MHFAADLAPVRGLPEQRGEGKSAGAAVLEEFGAEYPDSAVGITRGPVVFDGAAVQGKISLRPVWRIGHEHEVCKTGGIGGQAH